MSDNQQSFSEVLDKVFQPWEVIALSEYQGTKLYDVELGFINEAKQAITAAVERLVLDVIENSYAGEYRGDEYDHGQSDLKQVQRERLAAAMKGESNDLLQR